MQRVGRGNLRGFAFLMGVDGKPSPFQQGNIEKLGGKFGPFHAALNDHTGAMSATVSTETTTAQTCPKCTCIGILGQFGESKEP